MGRSKFPGKPSKSINRKRISVLQLDDDPATAATATATTTTTTRSTPAAANTTAAGSTTATEAANNESEATRRAAAESTSEQDDCLTTAGKNKRNCDDDDDDEQHGSGGGGGVGGGGNVAGTQNRNVNGNSSSRGGAGGGGGGGGSSNNNQSNGSAGNSNTNTNNAATDNNSSKKCVSVTTTTAKTTNNLPRIENSAQAQRNVDADPNETVDNDEDDVDDDEDDDDYDDNDNASTHSRKSQQSTASSTSTSSTRNSSCNAALTATTTTTLSTTLNRSNNRKFKNLNLIDKMLPSSTKLKLQQQQQQQEKTELNCSTSETSEVFVVGSDPFGVVDAKSVANNANYNAAATVNAAAVVEVSVSTNCNDTMAQLSARKSDLPVTAVVINNKPSDMLTTLTGVDGSDDIADSSEATNVENKTSTLPATVGSPNSSPCSSLASSCASAASTSTSAGAKKKTVTFKNILETSDDKSAVKKFYNPDNRIPLVSIMKKECLSRSLLYSRGGECIVRPSRLTEILKNNSNIDKLNLLKFRSKPLLTAATALASETTTSTTTTTAAAAAALNSGTSLFSAGLSRAFGAPAADEEYKHESVTFRFNATTIQQQKHAGIKDSQTHNAKDAGIVGDSRNCVAATANGNEEIVGEANHCEPEDANDDDDDDEQQMIVDRHFVLPKRSTRSSRVIKPNKRLLEDGIICKKSIISSSGSGSGGGNKSKAATSTVSPPVNTSGTNSTASKKEPQNYFSLGHLVEDAKASSTLNLGNKSAKEAMENKFSFSLTLTNAGVNSTSTTLSNFGSGGVGGGMKTANSFVLRQPRLQFDSLVERNTLSMPIPTSMPSVQLSKSILNNSNALLRCTTASTFSALAASEQRTNNRPTSPTTNNNVLSSGGAGLNAQSNCAVCGTPAHSKNVPQTRKYGVLTCEACRKFISKINKKSIAASASPTTLKSLQLQCKGGENNCCISAYAKGHIKNFKKIYKERCLTCWLKKCIQIFQFPVVHRQRLSALLPLTARLHTEDSRRGRELLLHINDGALKYDNTATMTTANSGELLSPVDVFAKTRLNAVAAHINLKSNPLAENNVTFGSSPLFRPAILEKSIFLKNVLDQQQQQQQEKSESVATTAVATSLPEVERTSDRLTEVTQKPTKTKRKERVDKEREKEKDKETKEIKNVHTATESKLEITGDNKPTGSLSIETTKSATIPVVNTIPASTDCTVIAASTANPSTTAITTTTTIIATTNATTTSATTTTATTTTVVGATAASAGGTTAIADATLKRQRIDLKGPRVKHVCRSASIVLGQPLATFGEDEEKEQHESNMDTDTAEPKDVNNEIDTNKIANPKQMYTDENDNCSSCKEQPQNMKSTDDASVVEEPSVAKATKIVINISNNKVLSKSRAETDKSMPLQPLKVSTRNTNVQIPRTISNCNNSTTTNITTATTVTAIGKKYMRQYANENALQGSQQQQVSQLRRKEAANKAKALISIDFWENYDPAEVCQTGFGLIVTETVAQRALCFLCGSTGLDALIFCACCCEPYHQYCVLDEYNLKHSSLDDTMLSLLDNTNAAAVNNNDYNQMVTNRLNWLCPRCTVCYMCNMSSGSKVKCQKCQKNYHSTCLGTSKRLLGADRPLICVNCLKCKSCATTKVSKFVGNLPMCTSCFKLRKKGNYCPICQKCYDDNDFDLKMMECGDCKQWVHSKCEGLSDEQYNLLSTLPEHIEFICKKCARRSEHSKQKAQDWRQAVMEEFKTSLMSVLKLLSKSRQACALLKLSPRKMVRCNCAAAGRSMHPKSLRFTNGERDPLGSDGESQCSDDIYEFKEKLNDSGKEQSNVAKDHCQCVQSTVSHSYYASANGLLSLVDIKQKINANEYVSLAEFNYDMNNVIQHANCDELIIAYKEILSEQFPWFQNDTKACTDALEEDMFESCAYALSNGLETNVDYATDEEQERSVIDLPEDIDEVLYSLKTRNDARLCLFCRKTGEGMSNEEARLLYCGHDCWVHTNCALWSAEVFEEIDGSLQNVHSAVSRGRMIKCTVCGNRGATVGCNVKSCGEHYHYPCARRINCAFLTDKTVYCPDHGKAALKEKSSVTLETNFEVQRPVYVELDRRRKKLIEPAKVQFHIGSLEVKQLGTIFPRFSDSFEAIVPINFLCSRLYWSYKEPWKIVEYTVRTVIYNNFSTYSALDVGRNFTVDHSNPNAAIVQMGLTQIARWHSSLARGELMDHETTSELGSVRGAKLLPEQMTQNQNQNSLSATDENTEEEPQTNADLLPPEIKDAIFEDLPHDILEGISMLDIFPKFMIYEDLGNGDGKSEMFLNEQSKDGINSVTSSATNGTNTQMQISDEDTVNSSIGKQLELSNSWSANANYVEDALLCSARSNLQIIRSELQRTKLNTEALKKAPSAAQQPQQQQRVWAKVENSSVATAAAIKRRKLSKGGLASESVLLSLSNQQRNKKEPILVAAAAASIAVSRRQSQSSDAIDGVVAATTTTTTTSSTTTTTVRTKPFTWSAAKRYIEPTLTERDESKIKLMQVDGVDDSITEYRVITTDSSHQLTGTVKCDRCHCTYRTYDSFQRHLSTCEPLSTSESESEATPRSPDTASSPLAAAGADIISDSFNKMGRAAATTITTTTAASTVNSLPFIQACGAFPQGISLGNLQANINGLPLANVQGLQGLQGVQGLQNIQGLQNFQTLPNIQLQNLPTQTLGGNFFISQPVATSSAADELQFLSNSLQGLTANLNGTYTLAPTSTGAFGAVQPQATAQLIAVSTNPDGTQQIIQFPAATNAATAQPTAQLLQQQPYQTLQLNNNTIADKKLVLPMSNGKPLKTLSKAHSHAVNNINTATAKHRLKANNAMKPIQSKLLPPATATVAQQQQQQATPITVLNAANQNLLNQNLLQQMQAAGLTAAGTQQPQLLFQTTAASQQQTPIIMQQLNTANSAATAPQNIISFVTTDGSQHPTQLQYVSIPTTTSTQSQSPFFTAATNAAQPNSLLQTAGATTAFLQTDASGNLLLTTAQAPTGGLQMLSATPLNIAQAAAAQPQVIGTLIQPQTLQLATTAGDPQQQQQQVIIGGGATGLEMITATNAANAPQVILAAAQPMYYGLETIVQNTVMSSQQFVSTAMPGVLSQNASFSATTTQVFQASKIEPIVDIPAGYVVLNNVDTTGTNVVVQQQQQQQQQQSQQASGTGAAHQQQQQPSFLNAATVLQQQQQQQQMTVNESNHNGLLEQPTIYRIQTTAASNDNATTTNSYQFATIQQQQPTPPPPQFMEPTLLPQQQQQQQQIVTAKVPPVTQMKRGHNVKATPTMAATVMNKVQPQIVNKVLPVTSVIQQQQPQQQHQQQLKLNINSNNKQPQQQQQQQFFVYKNNNNNSTSNNNLTNANIITTMPYNNTTQQQHQQQQLFTIVQPVSGAKSLQQQISNIIVSTAAAATTTTTTAMSAATPTTATIRKTNLIRPINKAEVKPKIIKSATTLPKATLTQQQQQHKLNQQQQQMTTTKLAMLKPQQQQQQQFQMQLKPNNIQQQQQQQQQQQRPQFTISNVLPTNNLPPQQQQQTHVLTNGNIVFEYQQQQQQEPIQQQQQQQQPAQLHYQSTPSQLTQPEQHVIELQQLQQQSATIPDATTTTISELNITDYQQQQNGDIVVANILQPIVMNTNTGNNNNNNNNNRLQYNTNTSTYNANVPTNIVNPLQQHHHHSSNNNNNSNNSNSNSNNHTLNSRPTNRVLPMQQRQELHVNINNNNNKHATNATKSQQHQQQQQNQMQQPQQQQQQRQQLHHQQQQQHNQQQQQQQLLHSNNNNNNSNSTMANTKCFNDNESKICYETESKKNQIILSSNEHNTQLQQQQQPQQILHVQQQQQQQLEAITVYEKTAPLESSSTIYCDAGQVLPLKCDLAGQLSLTQCQQVQLVTEYANNCLLQEQEEEAELEKQKLESMEIVNVGHVYTDVAKGICMEVIDEVENGNEDDDGGDEVEGEEAEDDDDDDFSLKMPTEDGDQDMSDSDEPTVKETISKILDNLTNEDCADSVATATTVEATAELNTGVNNNNNWSIDECVKYNENFVENETAVQVEQTQIVAVNAASSDYITQMAEHFNSATDIVEAVNYTELKKLEGKLAPQVSTSDVTVDAAAMPAVTEIKNAMLEEESSTNNSNAPLLSQLKPPAAPHHPSRDPKKISGPHLLYEIQSEDGFTYKSTSITDVWEKVFEAVQVARRAHGLAPLPEGPLADMSGVQMIGLKTNALKYLIEQLPGVERCTKYTPKYHKRTAAAAAAATMTTAGTTNASSGNASLAGTVNIAAGVGDVNSNLDYGSDQDELQENAYECARAEPYSRRSDYDMFSWLASRHRKQPIQVFVQPSDTELIPRRGTGSNLPMAMKYRTLKETYKDYVGVFRSHVHGRGLYCTKDIEAGEMVIEYAGELIRSTLTDKRERNYNSRGIGCYMFKIDDNLVVDATMRGNAARFINHSCEPNCYSKVVDILGHKHIIIFALRRIVQGEELTYDYKFPFEEEKIPCSCGSKKCRKYLN